MPANRRTFLKTAALSLLVRKAYGLAQMAMPNQPAALHPQLLHPLALTPFVDALPIPPRLPTAHSRLTLAMREVHLPLHRDLPPTRLWLYVNPAAPAPVAANSPLIEAEAHRALHVEWQNQLPTQHFLPIDHSLHGCGTDIPDVRAIVHLHGARARPESDGYPEDWYLPGQSRTCLYPLQQQATALWYHDHAMGLERLNIYAGLFGTLLLRDPVEDSLNLPGGEHEIPLTFYDRNLTADAQLFYPTSGDPLHPWVPEFSGDAIVINGKIRPYVAVEPRLYRFRLLNAANSRFFRLSLSNQQPLQQIGSDQGLLSAPVPMAAITLAPAERADILLDLSQLAGQTIHLRNGAFDILEIRIAARPSLVPAKASAHTGTPTPLETSAKPAPKAAPIPSTLRPVDRLAASSAVTTRTITLNEFQDKIGTPMLMLLDRKRWHEPVTERPRLNTVEIWEFVNLTEDTHPMHLHLVRFQILDRRPFDVFDYLMHRKLRYTAPAAPPDAAEAAWKDTVQCPAGVVTRIIVPFEGYTGRYLYHCHILEHASNDMMRPFEVIAG